MSHRPNRDTPWPAALVLLAVAGCVTACVEDGAELGETEQGLVNRTQQWGQFGDVPVPRDYDQDGKADFAVWRPSTGNWHILGSVSNVIRVEQWGQPGDVPVPGDFDHDGRPDFVVWRPSTGNWHVKSSATGAVRVVQWGQLGDIPMSGDFDGDGVADYAVYRPGNGWWYVKDAVTGATTSAQWGLPGDVPVGGDFDGVAGADFTVFRAQTGEWLTMGSKTRAFRATYRWGQPGDTPLAAQFGCSRKAGQTLWRPSQNGGWLTFGFVVSNLGLPGDIPVPADYVGDHAADIAVWRPSTGTWLVTQNDKNPQPCDDRWDAAAALADATTADVEGVTIAVVKNGNVVWTYGAGLANDSNPATPDIPWQIASLSKLIVGTAVLQGAERGFLNLDSPGGLSNPYNAAQPVIRDYGAHRSGMRGDVCSAQIGVDPASSLAAVLDPCLFWWPAPLTSWTPRQPGTYEYSNLGAAWPARLLEQRSGIDFAQWTRDRIFTPLGMTSTAWFSSDLAGRPIAQSFSNPGQPSPAFGMSPYAIGNLRSSANDLARFMIMWNNNGVANGHQILNAGSVSTATSGFGFYWRPYGTAGRPLWGHQGEIEGICTRLEIDQVHWEGVVILTNGNCSASQPHIDALVPRILSTLDALP